MAVVLIDPETRLTRRNGAAALTEAGFPTAAATLATLASRGGGPVYQRYGSRVLYRWGDLLQWAQSRLGAPLRSTSETDARPAEHEAAGSHRFPPNLPNHRAAAERRQAAIRR